MTIFVLVAGVLLDKWLGDPSGLPHLIVGFGKLIAFFEHRLNRGSYRKLKGGLMASLMTLGVFLGSLSVLYICRVWSLWLYMFVSIVGVFYCLAGKTLIDEVRMVFQAADRSLEEGRRQVARIVGRDTSGLSDREVRTAALETLAENLSDGVIAPLFWFLILGLPGMLTYKMINTLDSMIGYKNTRYRDFGCLAAHADDVANYIPARLTAFLMVLSTGKFSLLRFVRRYGRCHASPNSGYPEAALAGILDCRFGGPHLYFGEMVFKPFIGENDRPLNNRDLYVAVRINRMAEGWMLVMMLFFYVSADYFRMFSEFLISFVS